MAPYSDQLALTQRRDPIYRVRDSSNDVSGDMNLFCWSSDKSADAINRVPTEFGFFLFEWYCDLSRPWIYPGANG